MRIEREDDVNKEKVEDRKPTVTIIGSFRFKSEIDKIIAFLEEQGIKVAAPKKGLPIGKEMEGFKFIEGDQGEEIADAMRLQIGFMEAMINSDAVYIVNPEGYQGISSSWEIGYARAHNVPLLAMNPLSFNEPDHWILKEITVVPLKELPTQARNAMKNNKRGTFKVDSNGRSCKIS